MIPMALYCWIARRRNPGWRIVALLIAITSLAGVMLAILNFDEFLKIVGKSTTLTGRTDVWHAVEEAIRQRPLLGYGYGFWTIPSTARNNICTARNNIWLELGWSPPHAHNGWLESMLQLGAAGLFVTIALFMVSMSRAARLGLFNKSADAVFIGFIIANLFIRSWTQTVLLEPQEMNVFWFVVAYLYLAKMSEVHKHMQRQTKHPRFADYMAISNDRAQTRTARIRPTLG
jgi:O-antigen ligase